MKYKSEGQSLVECALLIPFMMVLMLGILEIGRAIFITIKVTNSAAAGAGYGAQNPAAALDSLGIQNAALCDADGAVFPPNGMLSPPTCNLTGILTLSNVTPTTGCTCDQGGTTSCNPMPQDSCSRFSCSSGIVVQCVRVQTQATFLPLFPYPGLPNQFVANGNAIMRVRK
jgi:hypothetical protein